MNPGRLRTALVIGCLSVLLGGVLGLRGSTAAFTAATTVGANTFTVDRLATYFSVTPGTDAVATGGVDTLAVDLGLVAAARTFSQVFTVTNVSGAPQSATLFVTGVPQVGAATFTSSSSAGVTLAPGASTAVAIRTSSTTAGRGAGVIELRLTGSSWLYRRYALKIDQAPEAPASLAAAAKPSGRIQLTWPASTTTNLSGYDVYRAVGVASLAKLATAVGTTYDDLATVDGTSYRYVVRAVSTGTPSFDSVASLQATATADATAPAQPAAASSAYVNTSSVAAFAVTVTCGAGSLATDTLVVTLGSGPATVVATAAATAGAGTVTIYLDARTLAEGALTVSATSTDAAGNVSSAATKSIVKDTVAPSLPTATYVDNKNVADQITGLAEAGSTVTATRTAPSAAGPFTAVAGAGGAYTVTVAIAKSVTVTYTVTATDAAGNPSAASSITFATTR